MLGGFRGHPALEEHAAGAGDPETISLWRGNISAARESTACSVKRHELLEILEDPLVLHRAQDHPTAGGA